MKTGQLCSHGTANVLQVSGTGKDRWIEAAREYNRAVGAATNQLLEKSKTFLTPKEQALVEKWFAKGLNAELNHLLAKQ
ncbi:MAG: hypothetical protein HY315_01910 [Acidobacteria bacterium]|nr:hypothetical protein [Acidobacteriota bacterium]